MPNAEGSLLLPPGWTLGAERRPSRRARTPSCRSSGVAPAPRTGSRGRCSPRSTRSRRTSAATWARARPAPSAGCSSCPTRGCAGASTRTATASPTRGTPEDAIYAAARYLAAAGGATDLERGIFAYNHADWYVQDVLELAASYGARRPARRDLRRRPAPARDRAGRGRRRGAGSQRVDDAVRDVAAPRRSVERLAARARRPRAAAERRARPAPGGRRRRRRSASAAEAARREPSARARRGRERPRRRADVRCRASGVPAARVCRAGVLRLLRLPGRRRSRRSSRSRTSTTTTRPPTSPRPRARRSTRWLDALVEDSRRRPTVAAGSA